MEGVSHIPKLLAVAERKSAEFNVPENLPPREYIKAHVGAMWLQLEGIKSEQKTGMSDHPQEHSR